MTRRKYQSIAYLVRGHWAAKKNYPDYSAKDEEYITKKNLELWFVFSDYFPKDTSNISFDDMMNLPSLISSNRRYDSDVVSAMDDIERQNQWRKDTATALGISEALHEYIEYSSSGKTYKQSKIAFWRECKSEKVGEGNMRIPFIIKPHSKEYDLFKKHFTFVSGKTLFTMDPGKEEISSTEAFVADEIKEIRNVKIASDGSYALYNKKGQKAKLIKKSTLQNELESEELRQYEQSVKNIEKAIVESGPARRAAGHVSTSSVSYSNRNVQNHGKNLSHSSTNSRTAWAFLIIIIIIILFIIFTHK